MKQVTKIVNVYFTIIFLIAFFVFAIGCTRNIEIAPTPRPFTAKIKNVQTGKIVDGGYMATTSFHVGDQANIRILAADKDLDIQKVYVRGYYPKNAETPHLIYHTDGLGAQSDGRMSFLLKEPFHISGPPGEWRIDIQIEDEERNLSNLYKTYLIVH